MALNPIVTTFGIDSVAFYNRTDGTFYGRIRVLNSSNLLIAGKLVELYGGSNPNAWDAQQGKQSATIDIKCSEFPPFVYNLFGGGTVSQNAADSLGNVTTPVNKQGTSIIAATGLASILVLTGSEANLKFGHYVVKATSASAVQIYCSYDTDFGRGTPVTYLDDTLAVLATPAAIATTVVNNQTALGIKLTGGASTTAFVVGDTATFQVRPKNAGNTSVLLGGPQTSFPEFGCIIMGKRKGTGEMFEAEVFRAVASGIPVHFDEDKFAPWDAKCTVLQDSNQTGIARLWDLPPLTAT